MQNAAKTQTFPLSEGLARNLGDPEFRQGYLEDQVRTNIAFQIHALRNQRGWTQQELAEEADKPASGISRLEDPDYGKVSLTTLLEIAEALDVALLVQFVEWDDWLERMADVSPAGLQKRSFNLSRLIARTRPLHPLMQQVPDKTSEALGGAFRRPSMNLPSPSIAEALSGGQGRQQGGML
jgi:transcriptional regulator with XRE-family HTH domain